MYVKFKQIIYVCVVFSVPKYEAASITNTSVHNSNENDSMSTECALPDARDGFCVSIYNCLILLDVLNTTSLRARRCGPLNENRKNPRVCCEKHYISYEGERSSTVIPMVTSTLSMIPKKVVQHVPTTFSSICGIQKVSSRLVGGDMSVQKEFPWLARLLRRDAQGEIIFACSGSLISSRVILTTAHCLISRDLVQEGELYAVSLGEHKTECSSVENECLLNKKTVMIANYTAHSRYNDRARNHDNDIGLIFLRDKVKFTDYISPICLLENNVEAYEYYVAGWGTTETGSVSPVKLKTSLPPYSWQQCAEKFKTINVEITERQICAGGEKGKDTCQGDSGGPLMVLHNEKWSVAGVVSFGFKCGRHGWPGIYVNVPSYVEWIRENMNQV